MVFFPLDFLLLVLLFLLSPSLKCLEQAMWRGEPAQDKWQPEQRLDEPGHRGGAQGQEAMKIDKRREPSGATWAFMYLSHSGGTPPSPHHTQQQRPSLFLLLLLCQSGFLSLQLVLGKLHILFSQRSLIKPFLGWQRCRDSVPWLQPSFSLTTLSLSSSQAWG